MHYLALAAVVVNSYLAPPVASPAEPGLDQLRGEWSLVSTADEKHIDAAPDGCKMVVRADGAVVLKFGDLTTNQGTICVGKSGKARSIDLKLATGLIRGLYELDGDDLAVCCAEPGRERPAGMTPSRTQWLERWRRAVR